VTDTETPANGTSPQALAQRSLLLRIHVCWPQIRLFGVLGAVAIIVGGLIAAGSAPARSELGAWAAAYLVLVGGAAQITIGAGQVLLPLRPLRRAAADAQIALWNSGTVAVIIGTATGLHAVSDAGGLLLLVALALSIRFVRDATGLGAWLYRLFVAALAVSVLIGLVVARIHPLG